MLNQSRVKEDENISSIRKHPLKNSERKVSARLKVNALGDVRNTIHSRPVNSCITNTNAFVKPLTEGSTSKKCKVSKSSPKLQDGNSFGITNRRTKSGKRFKFAASESVCNDDPTVDDDDLFETHNHKLCEEDLQTPATFLSLEYNLSKDKIENLVRSVKQGAMAVLKVPSVVPCSDVGIPKEEVTTFGCKGVFSFNEIFSDIVLPDVPAPVGVV